MDFIIKVEDLCQLALKNKNLLADYGAKDSIYLLAKADSTMNFMTLLTVSRCSKININAMYYIKDFSNTVIYIMGKLSEKYANAKEKNSVYVFTKEEAERTALSDLKDYICTMEENLSMQFVTTFPSVKQPPKKTRIKSTTTKVSEKEETPESKTDTETKLPIPMEVTPVSDVSALDNVHENILKALAKYKTGLKKAEVTVLDLPILRDAILEASDGVIGLEMQLQVRFGKEKAKRILTAFGKDFTLTATFKKMQNILQNYK